MQEKIKKIKNSALKEISEAKNQEDILELKIKYLGRKSEFNSILKGLKDLSSEEKKDIGQLANKVKNEISAEFEKALRKIEEKSFDVEAERIDVTMPTEKKERGHMHPLTKIQNKIEDIFSSMGFEIADGPEVETEFYNFDALNMPRSHPARDSQDTFWIKQKKEEFSKKRRKSY